MKLTINQKLQQAINYQAKKNFEEAEKLYKDILQIYSNHPHANHNLALISISKNDPLSALRLLKTAINSSPNTEIFWINYIHTLLEEKLLDEAEETCRNLILIKPESANAYFYMGDIYRMSHKFKEAEINYKKAIMLNSNFSEAYKNLSNVNLELGNLKETKENLCKAIEINPHYAEAYYLLGNLLKKIDELNKAETNYKRALEINPNYLEAHNNLAGLYIELNKSEEAESCFRKALEINPNYVEANTNLSILLRQKIILSKILKKRNETKKNDIDSNFRDKSFNKLTLNPSISNRPVEAELINNLYKINSTSIENVTSYKKGLLFGDGKRSNDFQLFEQMHKEKFSIIQTVEKDLINIMSELVKSDIMIMDSFFHILGGDSLQHGTKPHHHITTFDETNDLIKRKFSLTYYLSVGDQTTSEPGYLKFKDPVEEILPSKGMITIFPSNRLHWAVYNGKADRVMIGINFYGIS